MSVVRSAAVRLTMENASYIRGADQAAVATERATGRMQRSVRNAAATTGRDWDTMGKYGGRYALAVGGGIALAEKKIIGFDKTMSAATAATNANAREQARLRDAAIKAGADTAFTSSEAAQAIVEEGKAGISTANILSGGLRGALDLAAAGTIGVGEAAEYTATTLTQFHLGGDQARHVADLLAASAGKAQGEVGDMALALSYIGVPAHAARISLEETVGTIALLAKNGLVGEKAGTSLRGMLASLQSPSKQASKIMAELGINVYDAQGRFKGFDGVAQELHRSLGGLTDQERQYALGKIFGNEQLQAANILYEKGARGVHKMTREVNDQNYATDTANKKLDNLAGDWERLTGSLESAFIKAGSPAQQGLRDMVQQGEDLVNAFAQLPDEVQQGIVKVAVLTTGIGAALFAVSKIRNLSRDLRGLGGGRGAAGGLGRAASLGSPVPVFVTNLGAGGLVGKGGAGTVVGGGGAATAAEGKLLFGKISPTAVGRANTILGLGLLALEATGVAGKGHFGSAASLAGAGSFFGPVGTATGLVVGSSIDIYHSGGSTKSALDRANAALASGDVQQMKAALVDLQNTAVKLGTGGASQNFNRFVTEISGRRQDIEDTAKALEEAVNPKMRRETRASLDYLLTLGKKGHPARPPKPDANAFDTLLGTHSSTSRKPKPMTSEQVLAQLYGINPKKLKPVNLLDQITDIAGVFGPSKKTKAKTKTSEDVLADLYGINPKKLKPVDLLDEVTTRGPSKKAAAKQEIKVSLGVDDFERNWKKVVNQADTLNRTKIDPKVTADAGQAISAMQALKSLLDSLHDRNIHVNVTKTTNATIAEAAAVSPADGATIPHAAVGWTVGGQRHPYGDKVLAYLAPGEEVISNRYGQADRNRALLKAINANRLAAGGTAGPLPGAFSAVGAGIDYTRLGAAVAVAIDNNRLTGFRTARDAHLSALRTAFRETPVQRAPRDPFLQYGVMG